MTRLSRAELSREEVSRGSRGQVEGVGARELVWGSSRQVLPACGWEGRGGLLRPDRGKELESRLGCQQPLFEQPQPLKWVEKGHLLALQVVPLQPKHVRGLGLRSTDSESILFWAVGKPLV